jgi:type I protein arginine methyltransferase
MEIDNYFHSYEDLEIHELMLKDTARNMAYRNAILSNTEQFKVAIVFFKLKNY